MAARIIEQLIEIPAEHERNIFGQFDEYIKKIERTLQVTLISRDGILKIVGPAPNVQKAEKIIRELLGLSIRGNTIQSQNVDYALSLTMEEKESTLVEMDKNSRLYVTERLMTEGDQTAESNIEVRLNGEDSSAQIISRSVGKGNSVQTFHPKAVGNNKCQAHIQCDSIIMDHAEIGSIPEIRARDLNAAIIHEAAIGRINDEQLLKLRTLGLTEEEAENVIIENFLN